ncbi:hypothetical protein, partial [Klebsiella pneumoniae]|uniref:hypothetical protein n=1 Tax=Klebsiella pneumoniae TaxID=573 RepID=UPI00197AA1BE
MANLCNDVQSFRRYRVIDHAGRSARQGYCASGPEGYPVFLTKWGCQLFSVMRRRSIGMLIDASKFPLVWMRL